MEINYQIDDASLLKKRCISESDVLALLPQELRAEVHKIRLLHSLSCPLVWVIFLKEKHSGAGRCYEYVPFSGEVECNLAGPGWQYRKSVRTAFFMIPSEKEELSSWQRKGVSLFGKLFMLYDKKTIRRYMPHGMKFDAKYSILF